MAMASSILCGSRTQCSRSVAFQSRTALPARPAFGSRSRLGHQRTWVRASREDDLAALENTRRSVSGALSAKEAALKTGSNGSTAAASAASSDAATEEGLRELTKDDFWQYLEEAGSKLTVVDFFTDWCGPCKVMYPLLVKMAEAQPDVNFVKLNCNKYNKELGKKLDVKVAPTFHLYKDSEKVADMTGAKVEELQKLIEANK